LWQRERRRNGKDKEKKENGVRRFVLLFEIKKRIRLGLEKRRVTTRSSWGSLNA